MPPKNRLAKRLAMTAISITGAILFCELALRCFPGVLAPRSEAMVWDHWTTGRDWHESAALYNDRYEFDRNVGFVRRDVVNGLHQFQRRSRGFYALFLGDSLTEGDFTYASQVRELVRARLPGFPWIGLNTGTMGYDTVLEQRLLEQHAVQFHPNLIVLQFCLNDFNSTPVIARSSSGGWMAYNAGALTPWINHQLFSISKTYQFLAITLMSLAEKSQSQSSRMTKVREGLKAIARIARENKIPLRIMIFPYFGVNDSRLQDIRSLISELNLQSATIDLEHRYRGLPFQLLASSLDDPSSPSSEGHRIAAEALFENLHPMLAHWRRATGQ